MTRRKRLPNKLSALLRLAVEDAQICAKTKGYELAMGHWHRPVPQEKVCKVCMAGAVMACTLRVRWSKDMWPNEFDRETYAKLDAIDDMRCGSFNTAAGRIGAPLDYSSTLPGEVSDMVHDAYRGYLGRAPWHVYLAAADKLEKAGL